MRATLISLPFLLLSLLSTASAQTDLEKRFDALDKRLRQAEQENQRLREDLRRLQEPATDRGDLDAAIDRVLDEKMAKRGVQWKDLVRSDSPIQFYGFIRLDALYQTARSNSVITPAVVLPENGVNAKSNDDDFAFDIRLTRFGVNVDAGEVIGADLTGKIEIDFSNYPDGVAESRPTPRIRLAWLRLDFGSTALQFGQDWDIIAPYNPSVYTELVLWKAGNLGDRRPQARVSYTTGTPGELTFDIVAGLGMTGAVDNADLDRGVTPPAFSNERDGFDSGVPGGQLRVAVGTGGAKFGLWGYLGTLETDTSFGGHKHFKSQAVGVDWLVPFGGSLSLKGEAWIGQALGDVRGSIGQGVNPVLGREVRSAGGWTELTLRANETFHFTVGGSVDDPRNADLSTGNPEQNWTAYFGAQQNWGGGFQTGFNVIYWETDWVDLGVGNMLLLIGHTQLNF